MRIGNKLGRAVLPAAALAGALLLGQAGLAAASGAPDGGGTGGGVVDIPISFRVDNTNDAFLPTQLPHCRGDGETYTVRGHLVAPKDALDDAGRTNGTLYAHGHGYGEWFWHLDAVPEYNYAVQQAKEHGLVSVTYDKLGYDDSGRPPGDNVCYGTSATVMHQIIQKLERGDYQADGREAVTFNRLALAGHAQAAFTAELEAYSFHDADGLILADFGDATPTPSLLLPFGVNIAKCFTDGDSYVPRQPSDEAFADSNFADADPAVVQAAKDRHNPDPCGYPNFSAGSTLLSNQYGAFTGMIQDPVLLLYGADDPNFFVPAYRFVRPRYFTGSDDVRLEILDDTGQAFILERTAPRTRTLVANWLTRRGFGS